MHVCDSMYDITQMMYDVTQMNGLSGSFQYYNEYDTSFNNFCTVLSVYMSMCVCIHVLVIRLRINIM